MLRSKVSKIPPRKPIAPIVKISTLRMLSFGTYIMKLPTEIISKITVSIIALFFILINLIIIYY